MNCGANVLEELFRFAVDCVRTCNGRDGGVPKVERDWFREWPWVWLGGDLSTIDLGRLAAGACGGGMGEGDGDGDGELLLNGFLRIEEPLRILFVMTK